MIYPKDYLANEVIVEEDSVFVVMPFADKFNSVYGEIKQSCLEMMLECKRADDYFSNKAIMENILQGMISSELVIVDLTGCNANVFYELGIAHSLRDEDSVILITQEIKNSPFDINHISILEYDMRNTVKFRETLKRKIHHSRETTKKKEFYKSFLKSNKINLTEINEFIEISEKLSNEGFNTIYKVLAKKVNSIEKNKISNLLNYIIKLEDYKNGAIRRATIVTKLNLLASNPIISNSQYIQKNILKRSNHDLIALDDIENTNFITDFCFTLIRKNKSKEAAINWLVDYLHNYRMGRVDVIRTRIEDFFIEIDDSDIDVAILAMLDSEKITVRESAADICGQKKFTRAIPRLLNLLSNEENPHVVRSCMTALTRLEAKNASPVILKWMKLNQDKWGKQAVSASLRNIAISALKELDVEGNYLKEMINLSTL